MNLLRRPWISKRWKEWEMIRRFGIVFAFTYISYLISPIYLYAKGPWTSGGGTLKQGAGARPLGMGETFVGLSDDINAFQYNIAGLSNIPKREIGMMYLKGLVDTNYGNIAYAQPLGGRGYIGGSILTLQGGNIEINWWDGTNVTTERRKAQQDYIFALGYAHDLLRERELSIGANLKVMRSYLVEKSVATSFAMDIGGLYRLFKDRLSLGLSIQNIGTEMKYTGELASGSAGDLLPFAIRFGIMYNIVSDGSNKLTGVVDLNKYRYTKAQGNIGIEYWLKDTLAIRTGYKIGYDLDSVTAGIGFKFKDYQLDYGFGLVDKIDNLHKVSFILRFGGPSSKQKDKAEGKYQEGVRYYEAKEYAFATVKFNEALEINSNHRESQIKICKVVEQIYQQGLEYYNKGEYIRAISEFIKVLELNPMHKEVRTKIVEANEKLKK